MTPAEQQDARKETLGAAEAMKLIDGVDELYASRGKQVVHVDLRKEKPTAEALKALLIGPTGNLRAPTLRVGRTLVVGFEEAMYRQALGVS